MGAHVRQEAADAMEHAHQVDVDHPAPIVERDSVDAAAGGNACIVADYVDIAERLVRRVRCALDTVGIGNVAANAAHVRTEFVQFTQSGIQRFGLDIGQHHFHAGLCKGAAEREANAGGPARHECGFTLEFAHEILLLASMSWKSQACHLA